MKGQAAPQTARAGTQRSATSKTGILSARWFLFGAPLWGAVMALSVYAGLQISIGGLTSHMTALLALYFAGGTLAFPIALVIIGFLTRKRRAEARFSIAFICLGGLTVAVTAGLFAIIYRSFYAQWHGEFATVLWAYQLAFTLASALYQFAVIGVRNFMPLGLVFLVAASYRLAKTTR
ncbi:hypothetical protein [Hoeflea sp. TYP-13]|uniref:hypothetical protein n=1 Tax=Hoeflea sp. TYP-13 TaxID=3230023 RepID=UPI0034C5E330